MAKFIAIFTGKPGAGMPDEATIARGMRAWGEWMARNADRIGDMGGPLGKTKKVSTTGIADIQNNIGGCASSEHSRQVGLGFSGGLASSGVDI